MRFKKTTILITVSLCLLLTLFYFSKKYSWLEIRKKTDTPEIYLSNITVAKDTYIKDKSLIEALLKRSLLKHNDFFYSKEYFEGTNLFVDTILYNPEFNKLAILLITQNLTSRQLIPNKNEKWYYNATAYLAVREKDSLRLSWLGPNFTNAENKNKLSQEIREACFRTFVTKDTTGPFAYKYNMNDSRFWNSKVWDKFNKSEY